MDLRLRAVNGGCQEDEEEELGHDVGQSSQAAKCPGGERGEAEEESLAVAREEEEEEAQKEELRLGGERGLGRPFFLERGQPYGSAEEEVEEESRVSVPHVRADSGRAAERRRSGGGRLRGGRAARAKAKDVDLFPAGAETGAGCSQPGLQRAFPTVEEPRPSSRRAARRTGGRFSVTANRGGHRWPPGMACRTPLGSLWRGGRKQRASPRASRGPKTCTSGRQGRGEGLLEPRRGAVELLRAKAKRKRKGKGKDQEGQRKGKNWKGGWSPWPQEGKDKPSDPKEEGSRGIVLGMPGTVASVPGGPRTEPHGVQDVGITQGTGAEVATSLSSPVEGAMGTNSTIASFPEVESCHTGESSRAARPNSRQSGC